VVWVTCPTCCFLVILWNFDSQFFRPQIISRYTNIDVPIQVQSHHMAEKIYGNTMPPYIDRCHLDVLVHFYAKVAEVMSIWFNWTVNQTAEVLSIVLLNLKIIEQRQFHKYCMLVTSLVQLIALRHQIQLFEVYWIIGCKQQSKLNQRYDFEY